MARRTGGPSTSIGRGQDPRRSGGLETSILPTPLFSVFWTSSTSSSRFWVTICIETRTVPMECSAVACSENRSLRLAGYIAHHLLHDLVPGRTRGARTSSPVGPGSPPRRRTTAKAPPCMHGLSLEFVECPITPGNWSLRRHILSLPSASTPLAMPRILSAGRPETFSSGGAAHPGASP